MPNLSHLTPPSVMLLLATVGFTTWPVGTHGEYYEIGLPDRQERTRVAPSRVPAEALNEGLKGIVRHPNGFDLAAGFKGDKGSFVVVFLRQASGSYLAVDVSQVEQKNIGVIGPSRRYRDVHTVPTEWLPDRESGAVQLFLQTRAWDMTGRRYSTKEPFIITRDGTPGWR